MNIATRYARALWESARALTKEEQQQLYQSMLVLRECLNTVPALRTTLDDPTATTEEKRQLLLTASGGSELPLYRAFVDLVLREHRASQLIWMVHIFTDLYRKAQGIVSVTVESAAPLGDDLRKKLKDQLEEALKSRVECTYKVEEELIGGFRIRIGDRRIDASYRRQLDDLRRAMLS